MKTLVSVAVGVACVGLHLSKPHQVDSFVISGENRFKLPDRPSGLSGCHVDGSALVVRELRHDWYCRTPCSSSLM